SSMYCTGRPEPTAPGRVAPIIAATAALPTTRCACTTSAVPGTDARSRAARDTSTAGAAAPTDAADVTSGGGGTFDGVGGDTPGGGGIPLILAQPARPVREPAADDRRTGRTHPGHTSPATTRASEHRGSHEGPTTQLFPPYVAETVAVRW